MFPIRKIYFFKMFPERNFAEQKGSLLRPSNRRLSVAVLFTEFILLQKSAGGDAGCEQMKWSRLYVSHAD
jgi:hypothetical protein